MTIIVRRVGRPKWWRLRKCGYCLIGFWLIVGMFPSAKNAVIFLEGD